MRWSTAVRRMLCVAALLAGSSTALAQPADEVVASFGAVELRASDLRRILAAENPILQERILRSPAALDRLIRTEVFRRALLAEARSRGWDKRPEVLEQLDRARDTALVQSYVNSLARPPVEYPGAAEIRQAYEASQAEFSSPPAYRVSQIFIAVGPQATDETARRRAEELARRARAPGADFAALARSASEHAESGARGGDIGWAFATDMLPEIARAAAQMKPGEVSEPLRSPAGWHVVRLAEAKPPAVRPLEDVRDDIALALRERRARENEQRLFDELLAKNPIAVNEVALVRLRNAAVGRKP